MWCASRRPPLGSLPLRISFRSLSPLLAATFMPPRGRPTLVGLSLVTSSSVASFSSVSSCDAAACRSLVLAASFALRNSVLLAAWTLEVCESGNVFLLFVALGGVERSRWES